MHNLCTDCCHCTAAITYNYFCSMCSVLHQHHHHGNENSGSLSQLENEENDEKKWWQKFIPLQQSNKEKKDKSRKSRKRKSDRNINVRAAFIHVIGDLIQSVGILIAGYIIKFFVSHIYTCQKV